MAANAVVSRGQTFKVRGADRNSYFDTEMVMLVKNVNFHLFTFGLSILVASLGSASSDNTVCPTKTVIN